MITENQQSYIDSAGQLYRAQIKRAFEGKSSPRAAIKAKCLGCSNWQREEITHCQVTLCELHAYRPYQSRPAEGSDGGEEVEPDE
jgi:hypothetical protein